MFLEKKDDTRREGNKRDRHDRNSEKKSASSPDKRSGKVSGKGSSKSDDRLPSVRQVTRKTAYSVVHWLHLSIVFKEK